ncbi:MAG: ATP-grasp domain-containing protein [Hydrogenophilus thermoluteolus]
MKKVLLLGSSYSAIPIFFLLKSHGYTVHVCGYKRNDPCHKHADKSHFIDYSKQHDVCKIIENELIDFIVPTCNDYSYLTGSFLSEKYKFPGFDSYKTTCKLHLKNEFRILAKDLNLPIPDFEIIEPRKLTELEINIKPPLLIKPNNLFSGIGIQRINHRKDLQNIIDKIKLPCNTNILVAEKFIRGSLHSHSAFLKNKKIAYDFFVDEFCTKYPYQVNSSYFPSSLSSQDKNLVRKYIHNLAEHLDLSDGLIHSQFISHKGKITMIETMRRCPGDLYGLLIEKATGFNYHECYIQPFINKSFGYYKLKKNKNIGRYTIATSDDLFFYKTSINAPTSKIDFIPLKQCGDQIKPAPNDKLGIIFLEFKNYKQMQKIMPFFDKRVKIVDERAIYD